MERSKKCQIAIVAWLFRLNTAIIILIIINPSLNGQHLSLTYLDCPALRTHNLTLKGVSIATIPENAIGDKYYILISKIHCTETSLHQRKCKTVQLFQMQFPPISRPTHKYLPIKPWIFLFTPSGRILTDKWKIGSEERTALINTIREEPPLDTPHSWQDLESFSFPYPI